MSKLNKAITVLAKILEVCLWIATVGLIVAAVMLCYVMFTGSIDTTSLIQGATETSFDFSGISFDASKLDMDQLVRALIVLSIFGAVDCGIMATVCRNINLIFKTAAGQTRFSQGETPFQPATVGMVRNIGWLCIAIPIIDLIGSAVLPIVLGLSEIELHFDIGGVFMGLVALGLSQFFVYGAELQAETDGLV